jgi:3',5'-cyclic AMP phosphodiesterase CpdA
MSRIPEGISYSPFVDYRYYGPLLRWPNLGQPCLVRTSTGVQGVTFDVLFGAPSPDLNLRSELYETLFLQKLEDTRQVVQTRLTEKALENLPDQQQVWPDVKYLEDVWFMVWPAHIRDALIPLKVVEVGSAFPSPWEGLCSVNPTVSYEPCRYAYWVRLQIESRYLSGLRIPQLFNFVQRLPYQPAFHLNFHAVYLHSEDWHNFSFIHVTDPHIAWRNEFIQGEVQRIMGSEAAKGFINFNENFRKFIRFANQLHRRGKLDFIVMTGDLVEYINIDRFKREVSNSFVGYMLVDNFYLFRDLLTAWQVSSNEVVGEELEVPLFTTLGNHDYRPNVYPIKATYDLGTEGGKAEAETDFSKDFGLTIPEAHAYETGDPNEVPTFDTGDGIDHIAFLHHPPSGYQALINPDTFYVVNLGGHRIICLDSGHDVVPETQMQAFDIKGEHDWSDFEAGSPDSIGFGPEQIQFLEDQVKDADGLVIIAFHNPLIGYAINPPPLFRETVHEALTEGQRAQLTAVLRDVYSDQAQRDLVMMYGSGGVYMETDPSIYLERLYARIDYYIEAYGMSLENTRYFRRGKRDPDMGRGVADAGFAEFMQAITEKTKNRKKVELILYGHTHRTLEYIVLPDGDEFQFFHDYYFDGTIDDTLGFPFIRLTSPILTGIATDRTRDAPSSGDRASRLPDYPDPLSKSTDAKKWWQEHSPLQIQTASCSEPPPGSPAGVLRIVVHNDHITHIKRHHMTNPKDGDYSSDWAGEPHRAYPILFVSPP